MRTLITRRSSTKAERKFNEILKSLHIPFQYKVKVEGREVDFIIKNYAIDIDGHTQDVSKNRMLVSKGYSPVHLSNNSIFSPQLVEWLKNL